MAKIIIPGNVPTTVRRFHCYNCGCVFEADKDEYKCGNQYNDNYYICNALAVGVMLMKKERIE